MSKYQKKKTKTKEEREIEIQGAKLFGKHVSKEKGRALLAVSLIACALPMILGARYWDEIPLMVESGLIGANGEDDSIPRWIVAFGLPALMMLLNFLCHMQLLAYQKRMEVPAAKFRLVGRWGFPIISVLFCSGMIRQSIGAEVLPLLFVTPCVIGLVLLILAGHMWDCPANATIALRLPACIENEIVWKQVHLFTAKIWLVAGLVIIAAAMILENSAIITVVVTLAAVAMPVLHATVQGNRFLG